MSEDINVAELDDKDGKVYLVAVDYPRAEAVEEVQRALGQVFDRAEFVCVGGNLNSNLAVGTLDLEDLEVQLKRKGVSNYGQIISKLRELKS